IYILDAHQQPVPIGVPGELHIGGGGLGGGYWKQSGVAAGKVISHPLRGEAGARVYKTGGLWRVLSHGGIEFPVRSDPQVKLRGFRIELGEIEAVLSRHPAVRDCVVVVREEAPDAKRLVSYVVAQGSPAPSINELRAFLRQELPEYMLPSDFVVLD